MPPDAAKHEKFRSLPEDNFGVHVENEVDERRLLWLVNTIGEKKLRASANKRNKYYPDSKLFVSVLLKRFGLKVPPCVYTAVNMAIPRVYVLTLLDMTAIKIGITENWPDRAYAFVKTADYSRNFDQELEAKFDLQQSLAFTVDSITAARHIEGSLKKMFAKFRVPSRAAYGCGGHKEWFDYSIRTDVIEQLSRYGRGMSLAESIKWAHLEPSTEVGS
jgi:hypothetical protein